MAAPDFVAAASALEASASAISVTIPAAATAGDRAILVITSDNVDLTSPTGLEAWTVFTGLPAATASRSTAFFGAWHVEISSDPSVDPSDVVTATFGSSGRMSAALYVAGPSDVVGQNYASNGIMSATPPYVEASPGVTGVADEARAIHVYGACGVTSGEIPTWTADAATTERADASADHPSARNATVAIADEFYAGGGDVPSRTAEATHRVHQASLTVALATVTARPVANAGLDQDVVSGATVNLDGSATDGGGAGGPYTWQWTQTAGPTVVLSPSDTVEDVSFTAPSTTSTLTFELVATDSASVSSLADSVTISVTGPENTSTPVADDVVVNWSTEPGTDAVWEVVSDSSDATYAISQESPSDQVLRVKLAPFVTPEPGDQVELHVRAARISATSGSMTIALEEGASTVIASSAVTLTSSIAQATLTLNDTEISSISDPNNLYARVTVSAS